ncbi:MAG: class I tRNA ligase family protein, partial [Gammaproteobacteria bacterium]|nr:class I tRNA ligase family protein [Gammaproteobacteria bacterium]
GADALRFTFASLATQGMDIRFDLGRIDGYRNFCNKLWNAARYVLMNTEAQDYALNSGEMEFTLADRWIVSRLQQVEQQVAEAIRQYRLDQMAQSLYSFTWDEYCSWYVELSKVVLTDPQSSVETLRGTRQTLARVLETVLRLLHPIIPFITEEIWLKVAPLAGKRGKTVMLEPYPTAEPNKIDADALQEMQWMQAVVTGVRNIRGESNIEPGKRLPVLLSDMSDRDSTYLSRNQAYIKTLARLQSIEPLEPLKYTEPKAATALVGNMKVLVPLGSLIDRDAELERLTRDIRKLEKDVARSRGKLENSNFVDRAPKKVVAKERDRLVEIENALSNLREQYEKVRSLTL